MGLNSNASYPITMKIGNTTYNLDCEKFSRKLNNSPLVVAKPMTTQNGTNMPETLYKDLKNIKNTIDITFRVYATTTYSPIALAEDIVDKLHKEAPPIVINYRGNPFNCVFNSFAYDDIPKNSQRFLKPDGSGNIVYGGNTSPNFILCTINLTKGTKRI